MENYKNGEMEVKTSYPPQTMEEEMPKRQKWSNKIEFILSLVGYAVGIGNLWRFPYLLYRNGGGAFLIPYTLMLALAGLPLFFMELCLGQYAGLGAVTIWKICPIFKGIGYGMTIITAMTSIYANALLSWCLFYFFASFQSVLPWSHCNNTWNTEKCFRVELDDNATRLVAPNGSVSSSLEYWERYVQDMSDGIDNFGGIRWQMALCAVGAWVFVFVCLSKGVQSLGKVVWFTALFPYVILFCLLIRGVTLPGADQGILFYIKPDFGRLADPIVWGDAAVQIFYSLGPAWGGLITMASYNEFNNNCYQDAIIVSVVNCGTSFFAGFVVFSMLGFMAYEVGTTVQEVATSGPGLAFVAYPEGISRMPVAPLWAFLFFLMLITLTLDSNFTLVETVVSAICDEYPKLHGKKLWVTLGVCVCNFFLGLPYCASGGIYLFTLIDWYAGMVSLTVIAFLEPIVIMWIYGWRRFVNDIYTMVGFRPNWYWIACWIFITPLVLLGIILFFCIFYEPVYYDHYVYPKWAETLGWLIAAVSIMMIPIYAIYLFCRTVGSIQGLTNFVRGETTREVIHKLFKPAPDWGKRAIEQEEHDEQDMKLTGNGPRV